MSHPLHDIEGENYHVIMTGALALLREMTHTAITLRNLYFVSGPVWTKPNSPTYPDLTMAEALELLEGATPVQFQAARGAILAEQNEVIAALLEDDSPDSHRIAQGQQDIYDAYARVMGSKDYLLHCFESLIDAVKACRGDAPTVPVNGPPPAHPSRPDCGRYAWQYTAGYPPLCRAASHPFPLRGSDPPRRWKQLFRQSPDRPA